jgi:hypothetical protein
MSAVGHQSSSVLGAGSPKPNSILSSSKLSSVECSKFRRESHSEGTMPSNRDGSADKYSGQNAGNFSANIGRPRAFHLTQSQWRKMSSDSWRAFAGNRPGAAKFIAEEVECSPKTAQSWLDGESTPAGILDMRAMAKNPIYAALKREIAGMESTMDPRLQAKYAELHRLTLELAR